MPIDDMVATEEALVELYAAVKTGKWDELENRYGIKIHNSWRTGERSVEPLLNRVAKVLKRLMSQVIGRPITDEEVFTILSGIEKGIDTYAKSGRNVDGRGNSKLSLNESPTSEFAKAIDDIANGYIAKNKFISLGTTPKVLEIVGLPKANIDIGLKVIRKAMLGKHNVTASALKQIPQQINNPIAVYKSLKTSSNPDGYVVLTELTEQVKGKDKPIIVALNVKTMKSGLEVIGVSSIYGRNKIKPILNSKPLYWNKQKGRKFANTFGLQLSPELYSHNALLEGNVKTERSLSQDENLNKEEKFSTSQDTSSQDLVAKAINEGKTLKEIQQDKNILRAVAKDIEPEYEEFLNSDSNHKLMKNMRRRFLNAWKNDDFSRENGSHVLEGIIEEHYKGHKESNPTTDDLVQKAVNERREITNLRADEKFLNDFADALTKENNKVIESDTSTDDEKMIAKYYNEWLAKDKTIDNSYLIKEIENRYYKAEAERAKAKPKEVVEEKAPIVEEMPKRRFDENASPKELDKQYFKALDDGDNELAQQIVDYTAEKKGYDTSDDFRKDHQAPSSKTDDPNALNMMEHDLIPSDIWEHPEQYVNQDDMPTFYTVKRFLDRVEKYKRGELDKMPRMIVYRAVPKDLKEGEIRNGDWVTPSLDYAKFHGATNVGKHRIIKKAIPADQVYWNGDSIQEWGVDDSKSYAYKNTKNNRKLTDLETRDDNGDVIPPSKRFNSRKDDIRFSVSRPKKESLEKLRKAKDVVISGKEIPLTDDVKQNKRNALEYGKTIAGNSYRNNDTGDSLNLRVSGIKEILNHDYKDKEHLQSIAAIPQIIKNAVYIDSRPNEDKNKRPDIDNYHYFVTGLNIGGKDYVVRSVMAEVKNGDTYYDHKLSKIGKGELLSLPSRITTPVGDNAALIGFNDKRLLNILQDKEQNNGVKRSTSQNNPNQDLVAKAIDEE